MRTELADRLVGLSERFALPPGASERLEALLVEVVTHPLAPTAVREPVKVLEDHLADSLVALDLPTFSDPRRLVDIGSGAGFPGLVLAIACPQSEVVLLEASGRKCAFIEEIATRCRVGNVTVVHARAEAWAAGAGCCELATARAVGPLEVVIEYAAPLLCRGGSLIAWRGRRELCAERRAARAAAQLGMRVDEIHRVAPYPGAVHRHLHVVRKIAQTPPGFPRRPGIATKRPLGAPEPCPSDRPRR